MAALEDCEQRVCTLGKVNDVTCVAILTQGLSVDRYFGIIAETSISSTCESTNGIQQNEIHSLYIITKSQGGEVR